MKFSAIVGVCCGVVNSIIQYFIFTAIPQGTLGAIVFYSPTLIYFACIYIAIKRTRDTTEPFEFKTGLKSGVIMAFIASVLWGIGFFIATTHIDIAAQVKEMVAHGQSAADIRKNLASFNNQAMFDYAKFWSIPNFLLGFAVSLAVTLLLRRKAQQQKKMETIDLN